MSDSLLIQLLGDSPQLRVIDFLLDNKGIEYTKQEIMQYTDIPEQKFDKVWKEMLMFKTIKETRTINTKLYTLNNNMLTNIIKCLDDKLCEHVAQKLTQS